MNISRAVLLLHFAILASTLGCGAEQSQHGLGGAGTPVASLDGGDAPPPDSGTEPDPSALSDASDAAAPLPEACPANPPASGTPCTVPPSVAAVTVRWVLRFACEYGAEEFSACNTVTECADGAWQPTSRACPAVPPAQSVTPEPPCPTLRPRLGSPCSASAWASGSGCWYDYPADGSDVDYGEFEACPGGYWVRAFVP
jgi:hypothetical protein